jgi:FAD/FMN-containing dehydrogenase
MQGVRVDPVARRAYVQAGTLLGQLDHECAAFGLVTTAGTVSHTGAAGLTLGGGFGRVGRRFGLACDNLLAADVVSAGGKRLRAEDSADADLLWGLRGGSGNFGIVTQLEYALHPMEPVILGGRIAWPIAQARDVLRLIADLHAAAPDELNIEPILVSPPGAPPMIMVEVCWSADHAIGEQRIAALRRFGKPLFDQVGPMRYVDLQAANDVVNPHGVRHYGKAGFLPELNDAAIDAILDVFDATPPGNVNFIFQSSGGAIARVPVTATAFPNRASPWWLMLGANWSSGADSERKLGIARAAWKGVEALTRGFYVNSIDDRADAEFRGNFGANYDRLVALKKRYDPGNQFRLNANIKPG